MLVDYLRVTQGMRIRQLGTDELTAAEVAQLRALLEAAFAEDESGGFSEDDWQHALGGRHFVLELDGRIVAHAAVVERELRVDGRPLRTGYVEAVATAPALQRSGYGSALMRAVDAYIGASYELGALGTSSHGFYERLGWQTWRGPSYVCTEAGLQATPEADGFILVLFAPSSSAVDFTAPISCDWRPGDIW